jgi:peptidoglycan-associated lipoprotein
MGRQIWAAIVVALVVAGCETAPQTPPATTAGSAGAVTSSSTGAATGTETSVQRSRGFDPAHGSGVAQQALGGTRAGSPAQVAQDLVSSGDAVYFAFDSYALDSDAQATLDRQATTLLKSGSVAVVVEGHCDERGTREYNLALGERRATSVKDYLVAYGVDPGRIRVVSYGKERPTVLGNSETAWAKNRRAVTVVAGAAPSS